MTRLTVNGIGLNVDLAGEGPPLLFLHGFTGSMASWAGVRPAFAGFKTIMVDLIGHGASDAPLDPSRFEMGPCVQDLTAVLDRLGIARATVVGYSMGGRVALHLALGAPERVAALVLESASPGIADAAERAARVKSDEALADDIERLGVEAFVDRWEAQPLFASQSRLPAAIREGVRAQRLKNSALGLANSLRGMGAGVQEPLHARLRDVQAPTLVIAGSLDARYCAIAREIEGSIPNSSLVVIPEAGHTTHLEQPAAFTEAVRGFLDACLRTSAPKGGTQR